MKSTRRWPLKSTRAIEQMLYNPTAMAACEGRRASEKKEWIHCGSQRTCEARREADTLWSGYTVRRRRSGYTVEWIHCGYTWLLGESLRETRGEASTTRGFGEVRFSFSRCFLREKRRGGNLIFGRRGSSTSRFMV